MGNMSVGSSGCALGARADNDQSCLEMALMALRVPLPWIAWAALGFVSGSGVSAAAETSRDPMVVRGEQLSRLICSACHFVAVDQEFPPLLRQPAPPFAEIANREGMSGQTLRHFITTTHWDEKTLPMTMPNPALTAEQSKAISRYILSLRQR